MSANVNGHLSVPIVEFPPHATAASIADMLVGRAWSGGDYTSDELSLADRTPLAFATVTLPLSQIELRSEGMYSVARLLENNTLCALAGLGLSEANRANLVSRAVNGSATTYAPPRLQNWLHDDKKPTMTCGPCEWARWQQYGVRALDCRDQIPFNTACADCGNLLSRRIAGPAPPRPHGQAAQGNAVVFAQIAQRLAKESASPKAVRARLSDALNAAGYASTTYYRISPLQKDFNTFCQSFVSHPGLREVSQYPLRMAHILGWLRSEARTIHPVFVMLLDCFLNIGGAYGVSPPVPVGNTKAKPSNPESQASVWHARVESARILPVDPRRHYAFDDIPRLLAVGCTRTQMSRLLQTTYDAVHDYVRVSGLSDQYRAVQRNVHLTEARAVLLELSERWPDASLSMLRKLGGNSAIQWLYANDGPWIQSFATALAAKRHRAAHRPRCDSMPESGQCALLARRIGTAARRIRRRMPPTRASLEAIRRETGLTVQAWSKARAQPAIELVVRCAVESHDAFRVRKTI